LEEDSIIADDERAGRGAKRGKRKTGAAEEPRVMIKTMKSSVRPTPEFPACEQCGYSLRDTRKAGIASVCPECGTTIGRPWYRKPWPNVFRLAATMSRASRAAARRDVRACICALAAADHGDRVIAADAAVRDQIFHGHPAAGRGRELG